MIEKHEGFIFVFNFLECKKNNFGMGVRYIIISILDYQKSKLTKILKTKMHLCTILFEHCIISIIITIFVFYRIT